MATITADVPGVNRCVWNLAPRAPRTARPVAGTVTRERLDTLREADHIVMEALRRHGLYDDVWQCPTVLVPLEIGYEGEDAGGSAASGAVPTAAAGAAGAPATRPGELIVVRPVHSERAMTARAVELPVALIEELRRDLLALDGISGLALDITSKPPGTIEWE
jgi:GMP synthase (glutamine-hydrolysing)